MAKYGAKSPKPHKAWSNDPVLLREIHSRAGHLSKSAMAALKETQERALVVVGTKANGKRTYSGSSALKESQPLDHQMFHGHTHVLVLSHAHGMHACLRKPYPGITPQPLETTSFRLLWIALMNQWIVGGRKTP